MRVWSGYDINMIARTKNGEVGLDLQLPKSLSQCGLIWQGNNKWVEEGDREVRRIVKIIHLKGMRAVLGWGLSLGFLPVLQGSRLRYHRTPPSACLDVFEEPSDYRASFSSPTNFDSMNCLSVSALRESFTGYVNGMVPDIVRWFERVQSLEDVEHELEKQSSSKDWAYRIRSPKPAFVLAYVRAARGDLEAAKQFLDNVALDSWTTDQLKKFREALATAGPSQSI